MNCSINNFQSDLSDWWLRCVLQLTCHIQSDLPLWLAVSTPNLSVYRPSCWSVTSSLTSPLLFAACASNLAHVPVPLLVCHKGISCYQVGSVHSIRLLDWCGEKWHNRNKNEHSETSSGGECQHPGTGLLDEWTARYYSRNVNTYHLSIDGHFK